MNTFLEGVESITLACSLVVVVPAVLVVALAPRHRPAVAGAALVGTSVMTWARAGRLWDVEFGGPWVIVVAVLIVAASIAAFVDGPAWRAGVAGVAAGVIAGWLWQPCVGEHFAEVLNRAESDRITSLWLMHVYVAGLFLPLAVLAAAAIAVPRLSPALHHRHVRHGALAVSAVYAGTVAIGRYDDLVGELFRISSG